MPKNKKVFVFGMAKSGYAAAKLLSRDNQVLITDRKEQNKEQVNDLKQRNVKYMITDHPEDLLDDSFDLIVKNPGILPNHPCIQKAKKLGIKIINEVELAYEYLKKDITIIGITGSNGKTTTTTLVYEFLKKLNAPVHLGGNIGYPVCSLVDDIKEKDILLLEISDHQLVDMYDFKCDISVLLNLAETHLDLHGTYENYKQAKKKIFQNQTKQDMAVLNADDKEVLELTKNIDVSKKYFSKIDKQDIFIEDGMIKTDNFEMPLQDIKLKGMHNYENIMVALLIVAILGYDINKVKEILKTFQGVEHRIEFVRKIREIEFYNDSKSTNPTSTITALKTFQNPTILLLGGFERNQNFEELNDYLEHVKCIICYGESKNRIFQYATDRSISCYKTENLSEAIKKAYSLAQSKDTILLSPASASWDQYDNYEQRGNEFKEIVNQLEG